MSMDRRKFLINTTKFSVTTILTSTCGNVTQAHSSFLIPDKKKLLDLPDGFTYKIVDQAGEEMDDGFLVPGLPDGMGTFPLDDDHFVLMRNHELVDERDISAYPSGSIPSESFTRDHFGGVSRLVYNRHSLKLVRRNLVLTGTHTNCAGGPSPWGWFTCEETEEAGHGYVFLCDHRAKTLQNPKIIKAYGRFKHEAVAFDRQSAIAYLTEDLKDSCLYRFVPTNPAEPYVGKLQALTVPDLPNFATGNDASIFESYKVDWVDIADPEGENLSVRAQAQMQGATTFNRGEGIWLHEGNVYFCASAGGPREKGQIFRLNIADSTLHLVVQANADNKVDMPDNITFTSWGDGYIAEDGAGANYIRVLRGDGRVLTFAKNVGSPSEIAGLCFSPDENALFCNLQAVHKTLIIRGPFKKFLR